MSHLRWRCCHFLTAIDQWIFFWALPERADIYWLWSIKSELCPLAQKMLESSRACILQGFTSNWGWLHMRGNYLKCSTQNKQPKMSLLCERTTNIQNGKLIQSHWKIRIKTAFETKGYKLWYDSVKCTSFVTKTFLMWTQTSEILCQK